VDFPGPELGLVISYSYLWRDEAEQGQVEGRKNRPCAIVLLVHQAEGHAPVVTVAPITHRAPRDPIVALEIPFAVKRHLGLDSERSWIILDDFNVFTWPGYDLRPIAGETDRYAFGLLPPQFFELITSKFAQLRRRGVVDPTSRDAGS
jgi:hypothetical protein